MWSLRLGTGLLSLADGRSDAALKPMETRSRPRDVATPEALHRQLLLYREIFANAGDAVAVVDLHGRYLEQNDAHRQLVGYSDEELAGQTPAIHFGPEAFAAIYQDLLQSGRHRGEHESHAKDGTRHWLLLDAFTVHDDAHQPLCYVGVKRDITEHFQAQDRAVRLLEVAAALSAALTLEQVAEVIITRGMASVGVQSGWLVFPTEDGQAIEMGPVVGLPESVQTQWQRISANAPVPLADVLRTGEPLWFGTWAAMAERYPIVGTHSTLGTEALAVLPLRVGERVIGVMSLGFGAPAAFSESDRRYLLTLTEQCAQALERARLYDAEQRARQDAERAIQLRDDFLSVAAHELKTPMTTMRAQAQLTLRRAEKHGPIAHEQVMRSLRLIDHQTGKLARLVEQLLNVSRLRHGTLPLQRQLVDVVPLVREVVKVAQEATEHHRLLLSAPEHATAEVDPLRIEQVLMNLLDNAIKYSPDGGDIEVALTVGESTLQLAVRDHGLGIAPEQREQLFDRFFQAHTQSYASGMGLGLWISQQVVERHGGAIGAEFPSDGGSRFIVSLPIHPLPATQAD